MQNITRQSAFLLFLILQLSCSGGASENAKKTSEKQQLKEVHMSSRISLPIVCYSEVPDKVITEPSKLNRIQDEIENLKPFFDDVLGKTFGFIEMECHYVDGKVVSYEMYYSVYYGVVFSKIRNGIVSRTYYKNDDLEMLISKYYPEGMQNTVKD